MRVTSIGSLLTMLVLQSVTFADDWPQWLGPNRDSVWREKGIVRAFPEDGLVVKWRAPVALGYAGAQAGQGSSRVARAGRGDGIETQLTRLDQSNR